MAKQNHDIGYQKRLIRDRSDTGKPTSPYQLARQLVKHGICPPSILGPR